MTQDTTPAAAGPAKGYAAKIEALIVERDALRAFALAVLEDWPEFSGMDGGEIQDLAVKHGLLRMKDPAPTQPCGTDGTCSCASYYGQNSDGTFYDLVECFERTALLLGSVAAPMGQPGER